MLRKRFSIFLLAYMILLYNFKEKALGEEIDLSIIRDKAQFYIYVFFYIMESKKTQTKLIKL